jgi:hypothetical protein
MLKPSAWIERDYPSAVARSISAVADGKSSVRVYADERYADWLLWKDPRLRGRVAYDARFELLTNRQLVDLYFWRSRIGPNWQGPALQDQIIVVDVANDRFVERDLLATGGVRRLYRDSNVSVLVRRSIPSSEAASAVNSARPSREAAR